MSGAAAGHLAKEVGKCRAHLLRFAAQRVRDPALAEDIVQDALLAAVVGIEQYAGRSAIRSWLTGILRHKMVDAMRVAGRQRCEAVDPDTLAASQGDPEEALERRRHLEAIALGMTALPRRTAEVFLMSEVMGFTAREICDGLGITPNHCAVLLHRARRSLQGTLGPREGAV